AVVLNGGVADLNDAERHLPHVDGVMMGRAAYRTPYLLADVDRQLFGDSQAPIVREAALTQLIPYGARHLASGGPLSNITRHVLGLYHGQPRGRSFRRLLSEQAVREGAGIDVLVCASAQAATGGRRAHRIAAE